MDDYDRGKCMDWNKIKRGRREASRGLPSILDLPIIDGNKVPLFELVKNGTSLLDMGANDRGLYEMIKKAKKEVDYFSFDIDKTLPHDYYSIEDIDREFDIITVFEVVEHLPVDEVFTLLENARKLLKENGAIVISTPNVYHPVRFWRDCTHITPFAYDELVGLLISVGFSSFKCYRVKNKIRGKDHFKYWLFKPFIKFLGIDFAPGIVVVGHV